MHGQQNVNNVSFFYVFNASSRPALFFLSILVSLLVIILQPVIIFYLNVYSVTIFMLYIFLSIFQLIKNPEICPENVIDLYFIVLLSILCSLQVWMVN
jgi:hypothetical protein